MKNKIGVFLFWLAAGVMSLSMNWIDDWKAQKEIMDAMLDVWSLE